MPESSKKTTETGQEPVRLDQAKIDNGPLIMPNPTFYEKPKISIPSGENRVESPGREPKLSLILKNLNELSSNLELRSSTTSNALVKANKLLPVEGQYPDLPQDKTTMMVIQTVKKNYQSGSLLQYVNRFNNLTDLPVPFIKVGLISLCHRDNQASLRFIQSLMSMYLNFEMYLRNWLDWISNKSHG